MYSTKYHLSLVLQQEAPLLRIAKSALLNVHAIGDNGDVAYCPHDSPCAHRAKRQEEKQKEHLPTKCQQESCQ